MQRSASEKSVQSSIINTLRTFGAHVYSTSQARPSKVAIGLPDLLVFRRERFAFVEVKKPGGKLSPAQETFRAQCIEAGVPHHVWTSAVEAGEWCGAK